MPTVCRFEIREGVEGPDFADIDIAAIIQKVRKIVNWFRRSPLKTDRLRKITAEELEGGEKVLCRDCKTRWNTLFFCLERFYEIRDTIQYTFGKVF